MRRAGLESARRSGVLAAHAPSCPTRFPSKAIARMTRNEKTSMPADRICASVQRRSRHSRISRPKAPWSRPGCCRRSSAPRRTRRPCGRSRAPRRSGSPAGQRHRDRPERVRRRGAQRRRDLERPVAERLEGIADRLHHERHRIDDRPDHQPSKVKASERPPPRLAIQPPGPFGPSAISR